MLVKKILCTFLFAFMCFSSVNSVNAAGKNKILVVKSLSNFEDESYEHVAYSKNVSKKKIASRDKRIKGISYNNKTNTLTLKNFKTKRYGLYIDVSRNMTIKLIGKCSMKDLDIWGSYNKRYVVKVTASKKATLKSQHLQLVQCRLALKKKAVIKVHSKSNSGTIVSLTMSHAQSNIIGKINGKKPSRLMKVYTAYRENDPHKVDFYEHSYNKTATITK
ncbi:hypothetical protein SAMN05216520_10299 [Kandleria vitulina]|uniref:hypothetical protein n=1 Tax=Kandleria vitulina TaxID=1630 RepID=UPI00087E95C0|nr:hypothetical protein [Kandleria vitulina]SDL21726.1 hypothetical protein SAMN05216520_10299 [Kandleria vitulina]